MGITLSFSISGCVVTFQAAPFSVKPIDFIAPFVLKGKTSTAEACARLCYEACFSQFRVIADNYLKFFRVATPNAEFGCSNI